jgi:arylsulfatase A-like enzyme
VRSDRWKYIRYTDVDEADELYDLQSDPYEMKNLAADASAAEQLKTMKAELERQLGAGEVAACCRPRRPSLHRRDAAPAQDGPVGPNLIAIVTDDQGYCRSAPLRQPRIETPNMDGWRPRARCSPTRS